MLVLLEAPLVLVGPLVVVLELDGLVVLERLVEVLARELLVGGSVVVVAGSGRVTGRRGRGAVVAAGRVAVAGETCARGVVVARVVTAATAPPVVRGRGWVVTSAMMLPEAAPRSTAAVSSAHRRVDTTDMDRTPRKLRLRS